MKRKTWTGAAAAAAFIVLILDSKTALYGASEGIELCIRSVIPSLFPFFVMSIMLTSIFMGASMPILRPLGKLCGISAGAETIFLTGFLGGYPTGAQCVNQAYRAGQLKHDTAGRLLGFCSNAGPAFLFGMVAMRFTKIRYAWVLWLIQILSAVLVGMLLPGKDQSNTSLVPAQPVTLQQALRRSVVIMAEVCGWIILCRMLVAFCSRWFLWALDDWAQVLFIGVLELANGCFQLGRIADEGLRFVICSIILSLGGICVLLQTRSVTKDVGLGKYIPGKLLQACISGIMSAVFWQILQKI